MRRLSMVIWLVVVLVAVVTGCSGEHRYDGRLVAADSLIRSNPDSALAMLEALPMASLTTEGDRAYHGLLLAQARYKAYVVATSDSDINRALKYYRAHSREREKLTRSYIYKGAVMEELNYPDSAMLYYKHAEATAAPDDYFNQGYSKLRMGYLYGSVFAMDGKDIEEYEEAVECFSHTTDTNYQIIAMNNLGCVYRESRPDDAMKVFNQAIGLARQLKDTVFITSINHSKVVLLFHQQEYEEAHQLVGSVLRYQSNNLNSDFYFISSKVYSRIGLIDSARLFMDSALQHINEDDPLRRMYYLECMGEIALAKKDSITYLKLYESSQQINDSLTSNDIQSELLRIDSDYDKSNYQRSLHHHVISRNILLGIVFAVVLILITALMMMYYHKQHRYDRLIEELREESLGSTGQREMPILPSVSNQHLKDFITEHTTLLREVIDECYRLPSSASPSSITKIIKYQEKNKKAWVNMFPYIDMENNNIMSVTQNNYPQLNEKELMIIALTAMGYTCAQIAIIMGYSSAQGITTVRNRIADKMGIGCRLVEYVDLFKGPHEQ